MRILPYILGGAWLIAAAGCGGRSGDVVEISFWAMGREGEVVRELLPEFERAHPGIRVRVQQLPWTAAHEKLLTAFAGDATPDLCQLGNTWIPELDALHALEELDPWIANSLVVDPDAFFPGVWSTNVIDGDVLGVPWYVDTRLLFYRSDILREAGVGSPPTTWDEWREALRRVKQHVGPDRYSILLPVNEYEPPMVLALQQPSGMLRDHGTYGNFRSDDFRRAFTFYVDMFREGWAPAVSNTQISNVWQEFTNGFFSFYITGPWNIGEFKRRLPEHMQDDWMTAPMPGPDAGTPGWSVAGGASLVIFRASKHKAEAWALIEYLARPDIQRRFYEMTGNLPPNQLAWEDPIFTADPHVRAFHEQLEHVRSTPKVPEWERITTLIRLRAEAVINGRMTIDEALRSLDRDTDALLEKRRWMLARQQRAEEGQP